MNEDSAELIVLWFEELEFRLSEILKTTLYTDQNKDLFLPSLANIIVDTCSLIDTIFREEYRGTTSREVVNIQDNCLYFEPILKLSRIKTVYLQYPLTYIIPFENWYDDATNEYKPVTWWQSHNDIKHDRIREFQKATLNNAVLSVAALHQVISQLETFKHALLRHEYLYTGQYSLDGALHYGYDASEKLIKFLIETELFATPVGAGGTKVFPDEVTKINPLSYGQGKKLWKYVGREF